MNLSDLTIDSGWTLFLDRDGVINKRIVDGYVRTWEQFEFIPGVLDALKILADRFSQVIIVSNQQGIGKGLMTEMELAGIHAKMTDEIRKNGGRIDRIYHSPFLEEERSVIRKPNIGMALMARKEFPEIRFKQSLMVGDSLSDMIFGKRMKMVNVFLTHDIKQVRKHHRYIDLVFPDLLSFAENMTGSNVL